MSVLELGGETLPTPDEEWEPIIANPLTLPRLEEFLLQSGSEVDEMFNSEHL